MQFVKSTPRFDWLKVQIDGDDLVVRGVEGSYFGDLQDVKSGQDNGVGADGFRVVDHPGFLGVALPTRRLYHDSPIPDLRICGPSPTTRPGQKVRVHYPGNGNVATCQLCDLGPNIRLERGIDLTVGTAHALALNLRHGDWMLDYRIFGAAKLLSEDMRP